MALHVGGHAMNSQPNEVLSSRVSCQVMGRVMTGQVACTLFASSDLDRSCPLPSCLLRQLAAVQFVMVLVPRKYSQHVRKTTHGLRRAMCCPASNTELRDMQFTACANNGLLFATVATVLL